MDWVVEFFLLLYALACGASLGSFANVVVYRWPRGQSLLRPGSRCPGCRAPIAWYDNLPILAWLLLRGRCRRCQAAISPRYPLVEALFGLASLGVLLALIGATVQADYAWPPGRQQLEFLLRGGGRAAAVAAGLIGLVCWCLTAALLRWDGWQVDRRWLAAGWLTALAARCLLPAVSVWPPAWSARLAVLPSRGAALGDALLGTLAGVVLGRLVVALWPRRSAWHHPLADAGGSLAIVGVLYGAAGCRLLLLPALGGVLFTAGLGRVWPRLARLSFEAWLPPALFWAVIQRQFPPGGAPTPATSWWVVCGGTLAALLVARLLNTRGRGAPGVPGA